MHLIGRSGRGGTLAVGNAAGSLSICRCDASSKEEASALIDNLRQRGQSLPGKVFLSCRVMWMRQLFVDRD